ncbi:hypothetical protein BN8_03915 [Fibrisoma limi BUZ 3]|uniref:Uncharacterized protein n=1 Tax=Fibrisoma limi BUZ 3 TaxID=1185876 RepID=I2GLE0_9BACT|nr:hypothetical protein [Fibrisoma limi]CCH54716.1 hypothetical protein BN8_03915 [Fibrisoma limi BUZ 3]
MERAHAISDKYSCFDSLMSALRFISSLLEDRPTGLCITYGPDKRYYVVEPGGYQQLSDLGHEVISLF